MIPARVLRCHGYYKRHIQVEVLRETSLDVSFLVRVAAALKVAGVGGPGGGWVGPGQPAWRNPFLPPEPELFVRHLGPEHSLVLNKFNVVHHHVLVITREFRSQAEPLYGSDLAATLDVVRAMPAGGVAFYNCGPNSGRSQPHKHMQAAEAAPLQPLELRRLPYRCYVALLPDRPTPQQLEVAFHTLLQTCFPGYNYEPSPLLQEGSTPRDAATAVAVAAGSVSYNVLLTSSWMMLVPRGRERCGPLALNSLAFAGPSIMPNDPRLARCGFAKLQGEGIEFFIRKYEITMGRTSKNSTLDLILGDSTTISRQHATIRYNFDAKCFELAVLGKNGVTVESTSNGTTHLYTPESPPTPLRSRDLLIMGEKRFYFLLPRAMGGQSRKRPRTEPSPAPGPLGAHPSPKTPRNPKRPHMRKSLLPSTFTRKSKAPPSRIQAALPYTSTRSTKQRTAMKKMRLSIAACRMTTGRRTDPERDMRVMEYTRDKAREGHVKGNVPAWSERVGVSRNPSGGKEEEDSITQNYNATLKTFYILVEEFPARKFRAVHEECSVMRSLQRGHRTALVGGDLSCLPPEAPRPPPLRCVRSVA
ncbi:hypothetical protein VOLCADRAFT_92922 [Volvox carteri f. nagariensis]|uniref:FHA domain-containing protein n=1 Tax=Volvox carteri f. nagariensis TaxID=3068 RepID=D8U0T8_VOLCA|nr:uncharacterized protein VOLCADRAFT_92922 [Volvox carteri f. nagariensis]EFJ46772.1 hypothetical protein VOLCADRAFT_92922 [Volvox carteri f. nagariensis]|eukprot:XP_002952301.1 hypothetical protein VOLCADRAFT_92922 [Volvox carteri f. nagariensis]